jgi:hypothetical protein
MVPLFALCREDNRVYLAGSLYGGDAQRDRHHRHEVAEREGDAAAAGDLHVVMARILAEGLTPGVHTREGGSLPCPGNGRRTAFRVQHFTPAFEQFFFQAIKDHMLLHGRIDAEEAAWLRRILFPDGKIDDEERKFLHELEGEAKQVSREFGASLPPRSYSTKSQTEAICFQIASASLPFTNST